MLFLKKSTIPAAGKGLFTKKAIKKGEDIIEYKGEIVTWAECLNRNDNGHGGYVFFINKNYCIDAYFTPSALARYANDAKGHIRVAGITNNAVYETRGKKVFIVATKNIEEGGEVLVDYGKDYWEHIPKPGDKIKAANKKADSKKAEKKAGKKKA
jgi:SET domain-containing protein